MMGEEFLDASWMLRSGCYALLFAGEVVYIGKARRLGEKIVELRRKMQAVKRVQAGPKAIRFSEVWVAPCSESDLDRKASMLIARYKPRFNDLPEEARVSLEEAGFDFTRLGFGTVKATPIWRRL